MGDNLKDLQMKVDFLVDCALVSRDWNAVATNLLYHGPITLRECLYKQHLWVFIRLLLSVSSESARLLLRTVENGRWNPCPIQQLKVTSFLPVIKGEFELVVQRLITCCTELRYLYLNVSDLSFEPIASLPVFEHLRELHLTDMSFRTVAPLLHRLPYLKVLHLHWVTARQSLGVRTPGAPPIGDPLDDIPPPTFQLDEFGVQQSELAPEQFQWLLSQCTSLSHVELRNVGDSGPGLARVIGPHTKTLSIHGIIDVPRGDDRVASQLMHFTSLTSLQISGRGWPWNAMFMDIVAPLETIQISYSQPACDSIAQFLLYRSWLPSLRAVVVDHEASEDRLYRVGQTDIEDAKAILKSACATRNITLRWLTNGA